MEDKNKESLETALKATQQLRTNVSKLFSELKDGVQNKDTNEDRSKAFLSTVSQNLLAVNNTFSDLEKHSMTMAPGGGSSLGNIGVLSLDPVVDKQPMYQQLLGTYGWSNKMHDYAQHAASLLTGNSLKRSNAWLITMQQKRLKKTNPSQAVNPKNMDTLIQNLERIFPHMTITLTRPMGSPTVLVITLGKVMKVLVVLRGLIVEWVRTKSYSEEFTTENGKLDIWSTSKYEVFQKISDHTKAAMLHFFYPSIPDVALKSFLTWLHSYHTLFSQPCTKCGRFLQDNLPPTWRDFFSLQLYHEHCRP